LYVWRTTVRPEEIKGTRKETLLGSHLQPYSCFVELVLLLFQVKRLQNQKEVVYLQSHIKLIFFFVSTASCESRGVFFLFIQRKALPLH